MLIRNRVIPVNVGGRTRVIPVGLVGTDFSTPLQQKYLARDEFIGPVSIGIVHNTGATPGPGRRSVVDGDGNKLFIDAHNLVYAPKGVVTTGDPGLWLDIPIARVPGRFVVAHYKASTIGATDFQFDSNLVTAPIEGLRSGAVMATLNNGAGINLGGITMAAGVDYYFITVLRTAGAYKFYKISITGLWKFGYFHELGNVTPLYAAISNRDSVAYSRFLRVYEDLLTITPQAYDTFTRPNNTLGRTESIGPENQATISRTWTDQEGTWGVSGNVAMASALAGGIAVATYPVDTPSVMHAASITRAAGNVGIVMRYVDANNYVYALHNGANAQLIRRVGGVDDVRVNVAAAYGAGNRIAIFNEGTTFTLYYNNVMIGAVQTINDAILQPSCLVGLYTTNIGNSIDNAVTFAKGIENQYSVMDRYIQDAV